MATKVVMPKWGTGMNEGTILRWMKAEGDQVNEGENIVEIETTKTTQELEAPASGVLLKIILPEGQTAEVRTLIGIIGEPGEDVSALLG
jgi:pyruvate/2-oxoglutarate dehydrogenase complex dihydrolipoamide acyltransferase (E2) component